MADPSHQAKAVLLLFVFKTPVITIFTFMISFLIGTEWETEAQVLPKVRWLSAIAGLLPWEFNLTPLMQGL